MRNGSALFFTVFVMLLSQASSLGDSYPSRPIKIIVPGAPGGAADQRSRQIAEKLSNAVGQPVVVENRPGASGAIGASAAAKAPADGYTLFWGTLYDLVINPVVNHSLDYEPLRDFAPITQAVSSYLVLSARPGLGVKSIGDLIAVARAKPGQLSCGSAGNATAPHFALELFERATQVDITHVAFKGDAPVVADLLGSHIDIAFTVTTVAMPHIKAGTLVPLVVSSSKRLTVLPEVPTVAEAGFPQLEITLWGGVLAPVRTSPQTIRKLNLELGRILNSSDIREKWASGGAQAVATSPDEFTAFIRTEQARWIKLIQQTGVKME